MSEQTCRLPDKRWCLLCCKETAERLFSLPSYQMQLYTKPGGGVFHSLGWKQECNSFFGNVLFDLHYAVWEVWIIIANDFNKQYFLFQYFNYLRSLAQLTLLVVLKYLSSLLFFSLSCPDASKAQSLQQESMLQSMCVSRLRSVHFSRQYT